MTGHRLFAPRRVGVCGSSEGLPAAAVLFCKEAGEELSKDKNVIITSPGAKRVTGKTHDDLAADWHIVNAAEEELKRTFGAQALWQRIETVFSDKCGEMDENKPIAEYFQKGTLTRALGNTREARNFSFVKSLDGLLTVAGGRGTAQALALALEWGKRLLPVPCFAGKSKDFWRSYNKELTEMLGIDEASAERWTVTPPDDEAIKELARDMVRTLVRSLPRRCFVAMPFSDEFVPLYDFVIAPVVVTMGDHPIRVDYIGMTGDVGQQIQEGLRRCDCVIAVLDGFRPNVLYEIGFAHACGKPTVLFKRAGALNDEPSLPFNLSTHQVLQYETINAELVDRLKHRLKNLLGERP
jgi:hypothetical protein